LNLETPATAVADDFCGGMSMSQTSLLIEQAERRAQLLRPATLKYGTITMPIVPGNLQFFERLRDGGVELLRGQQVRILRRDIPANITFRRGEVVTVKDMESGDEFQLEISDANSQQAGVMILNLERQPL
jgi:hypothetical protein